MSLLSKILAPLIDKRISSFQNSLMETHITEVENIYGQMRGWRHDYHSHMQAIKAHLHLAQYKEADDYVSKLAEDLTQVDVIIKTGNIMVDAILNSKVSIARTKEINVNVKAAVPSSLIVSEIDLCVIIGNLLDNATEACGKITNKNERFIRIYIDVLKKQLYVSVSNAMTGEPKRSGLSFLSTKRDTGHGYGLKRIDKITEKYGGYINRQSEGGVFATEVLLPV